MRHCLACKFEPEWKLEGPHLPSRIGRCGSDAFADPAELRAYPRPAGAYVEVTHGYGPEVRNCPAWEPK